MSLTLKNSPLSEMDIVELRAAAILDGDLQQVALCDAAKAGQDIAIVSIEDCYGDVPTEDEIKRRIVAWTHEAWICKDDVDMVEAWNALIAHHKALL